MDYNSKISNLEGTHDLVNGSHTMTENDTLVSLEEYIKDILPGYLQKVIAENGQADTSEAYHDLLNGISQLSGIMNKSNDIDFDAYRKGFETLSKNTSFLSNKNLDRNTMEGYTSWTFIQGFFLGQLTVVLTLIFFLKFFIFSDSSSSGNQETSGGNYKHSRRSSSNHSTTKMLKSLRSSKNDKDSSPIDGISSSIIKKGGKSQIEVSKNNENDQERPLNVILEKVYYNVEDHTPESLDWFNVLIAQTIQQFREEAWLKENIVHSLNHFLESKADDIPDFLGDVEITEVDIGDDFPIFSNCRIQYSPNSNKKRLEAKIDIDLKDRIALGVKTKLLLNYPLPGTVVLPIELTVAIVRFQACLTVSLTNAEDLEPTDVSAIAANLTDENSHGGYYLMFSFPPEYKMEFDVSSLIGARSKLENIPKIGSVIEHRIKKWFVDRCVEPRFQCVKLPSIWPRSKNTRQKRTDSDDATSSKSDT